MGLDRVGIVIKFRLRVCIVYRALSRRDVTFRPPLFLFIDGIRVYRVGGITTQG